MIRRHEFNSEWWGSDVGVVEQAAFFELAVEERARALAPFVWAEYKGALEPGVCARAAAVGFVLTDTQLAFRLGLGRVPSSESVERLAVRSADQAPFEVGADEVADFEHERFANLPGATQRRINERYALWSRHLIDTDPAWCLQVLEGGDVQGWFLARKDGPRLHLTLAMLRRGARVSGHSLYHRAVLEFARRGARIGFAEFSVTNTAVHNIYAALGARFLAPVGCWLWHPGH